jgi:hypothetical protein
MFGVASWSFATMNERPELRSGQGELNVHLWALGDIPSAID